MNSIFVFWTGDNSMSPNRLISLKKLQAVSEYNIILVTKDNLSEFLRPYFMHHYGGGYSDIKQTLGSWKTGFKAIENSTTLLCGYPEFSHHQIAHVDYKKYWNIMVGCGAFISKPNTPFTKEWYLSATNLIVSKTSMLKKFPASHPQECSEGNGHEGCQPHGVRSNYPIEWNEIMGRIFHPLVFKYRNFVSRTVPRPVIYNYR